MHPLVIHQPAFPPEQAIRHPPAPADVIGRDLPEASPELGLLYVDNLGGMSLSAAVLAHHLAGEPLRYPEHGAADVGDGLALGDQLLGRFELADDLLRRVPDAFHDEVPGPAWPVEDSHSPRTGVQGPRQQLLQNFRVNKFKHHGFIAIELEIGSAND